MEGEVYPYFNSEKLEKIPKKNTKQLENVKLTSEKQKTSQFLDFDSNPKIGE